MNKTLKYLAVQTKYIVLWFILVYQHTLSFDHGPLARVFPFFGCRFHPSCSQYTYEAVAKYGILKGCWLGAKRILRCTPFSKGGYDPLP
jgi:hypothetical protein